MTDTKRRELLKALAMTGVGLAACSRQILNAPVFNDYPFQLGVASGEPASDGFVIWTRIVTQPLERELVSPLAFPVRWEVSRDESMSRIVRSGEAIADPDWGHSIHVELENLEPGQAYFYRFYVGNEASPIGRCRTLPINPHQIKFVMASCQAYERGFFTAYRNIIEHDPDFLMFVGDYIYEATGRTPGPRSLQYRDEVSDLWGYRMRLGEYKLDPDLQAAHQAMPWIMNWDDHEVDNDYAGLDGINFEPRLQFALRRKAAYQAFYEHMPLRERSRPKNHWMQIYRRFDFGGLATLLIQDGRQYRDAQACRVQAKAKGRLMGPDCTERLEPKRSYLGNEQEEWTEQQLARSTAQWNIIGGPQLFAPFRQTKDDQPAFWNDDWNGYPAARIRMTDTLKKLNTKNAVFLGGDIHSHWANNIPGNPEQRDSTPIATEFVTTSLTSHGPPYDYFMSQMSNNPHVQLFESRYRGYTLFTVDRAGWKTNFYAVDHTTKDNPEHKKTASFLVEAGRPKVNIL